MAEGSVVAAGGEVVPDRVEVSLGVAHAAPNVKPFGRPPGIQTLLGLMAHDLPRAAELQHSGSPRDPEWLPPNDRDLP
ncbi:MAG: hypothetical protein ACRDZQ_03565 [Acidimicrobiales bacterium]